MLELFLTITLVLSVTIFYHRYFSHHSFETSRVVQFIGAVLGSLSLQGGPLWWASQHIHHHKYSDNPQDPHSPKDGLVRSHFNWFLDERNKKTRTQYVRHWMKYPELMWLNRYWYIPPIVCFLIFGTPYLLAAGLSFLIVSMLASLSHVWGTQDYNTGDTSRNNFVIAMFTMGEGWHNNHHYRPWSANHGFKWWQIDISYYVIWLASKINIVWNIKQYRGDLNDGQTTQ